MTRKECLEQAMECVLRDRQNQYGEPEDCFETIAMMWSAYLGKIIQGWDVAAMMALLKIARIKANPAHADNWCDLAGYAACGAECRQKFEAEMKKTVEDTFETFPHLKPETESGCFQNGNDHSPEASAEPEFKPGDPVEWFSFGRKDAEADGWHPAFYLCRAGDRDYHVVQDIDGMYHVVNYANIRSPEAMYRPGDKVEALSFDGSRWEDAVVERTEVASGQWHCTVRLASGERHRLPVAGSIRRPSRDGDKAGGSHPENPDSSTATQPEVHPGDKMLVTMPDGEDMHCIYVGESKHPGCCCVRYLSGDNSGDTDDTVPLEALRRPPETESNCFQNGNGSPEFKPDDKVQAFNGEEWVDCRYIRWKEPEGRHVVQYKGCMCAIDTENLRPVSRAEGCEALVEKDAPQTREELYSKILESNPSTFGCAHKPTGEELAEMAEEEEKHG